MYFLKYDIFMSIWFYLNQCDKQVGSKVIKSNLIILPKMCSVMGYVNNYKFVM